MNLERERNIKQEFAEYKKLLPIAEQLVKDRIKGDRKGMTNEPNYLHSFRVQKIVMECHEGKPDYDLYLAAGLHDVVEDGGVTLEELRELGFSKRTIHLVDLCTHDKAVENHTQRWILMMARLIEANDADAWSIKLADMADNVGQSRGLKPENRIFMREARAPILLRLTEGLTGPAGRCRSHLVESLAKAKKLS